MLTRETQVVRLAVVSYHGDSNPKIKHEKKIVISITVCFSLLFYVWKHFVSNEGLHHYDWNIGKRRHLEYSTCSRIITWLPSKIVTLLQ